MIVNILWVSVWMVFMLFLLEAKVTWNVVKQIAYGENLELFCISDDYNMSSPKSKRWYRGPEEKLLTFNNGSEDITKYNASVERNGFKLIFKNLTENDMNETYRCAYGFTKSENLPLLAKDVYKKNLPARKGELEESNSNIAVILGIVMGAFIVILISVLAILYKRGRLVMVTKICFNRDPQNAPDPYVEVQYDAVPPNETNGNDNQPTNIGQYDGVRHHPIQPNESNGTNNQGTNMANRFCHHPSNEDIRTSGTPQTSDKSFQSVIVTSVSRVDACKTPQPQQLDDEYMETYHVADTERSNVSFQQEEVVLPDNNSHLSNPNLEEEIIISSAIFPAYSKKRVREQSFTEWSLSEPSKQKMATAGFFYKGCNTYAQCFCCGFNQKWRENDDPFSSSLHNDNCSYSEK